MRAPIRPDGTRLRELAPIVQALPCIMSRPHIRRKRLSVGAVMDGRVATGIGYSRFFAALERYLKRTELPETCLGQGTPARV